MQTYTGRDIIQSNIYANILIRDFFYMLTQLEYDTFTNK